MRAPVGLQAVGAEPDGLLGLEQRQLGQAVEAEALGGGQPVAADEAGRPEDGQAVDQMLAQQGRGQACPAFDQDPRQPAFAPDAAACGLRSIAPASPAATSITSTPES